MKIYYVYNSEDNIRRAYLYDNQIATKLKISHELIDEYAVYFMEKDAEEIKCENEEQLPKKIEEYVNSKIDFGRYEKYNTVIKSDFIPGEYHPRIYRPIVTKVDPDLNDLLPNFKKRRQVNLIHESITQLFRPIKYDILNSTINQIELITNELLAIFQTVHPSKRNFESYGHRIRNLFIIACTEVEAQLKGILVDNVKTKKKNYSTLDYVKLLYPLKLNEYELGFIQYPDIEPISPFAFWKSSKPTESLSWYRDYNAVKHDRESEFDKSTLLNLIYSISAIVILCYAQFGEDNTYMKTRIGNSYKLHSKPKWEDKEHYFPPAKANFEWNPKKLLL